MVAPVCKNVLSEAHGFFKEFNTLYDDVEDCKANIDILVESTGEITKGFEICTNLHQPMLKEASKL